MRYLSAPYLEVWAASRNLPLIRFAHRRRSIASSGLDLLGIPDIEPPRQLVAELESFDEIVSWYGANRPEFRECVTALGLRFKFLNALPSGTNLHAIDFYLQQAGGVLGQNPSIDCPRNLQDFIVIHPFSGNPQKNWPLENYRNLASQLREIAAVKWCVGPEDNLEGAVRIDDLYELACWLATARLYIGNDSGIAHLAAAVGTPVLALFGPTDPAIWAPRGPNVRIIARSRMDAIDLEEVLAAAKALWKVWKGDRLTGRLKRNTL